LFLRQEFDLVHYSDFFDLTQSDIGNNPMEFIHIANRFSTKSTPQHIYYSALSKWEQFKRADYRYQLLYQLSKSQYQRAKSHRQLTNRSLPARSNSVNVVLYRPPIEIRVIKEANFQLANNCNSRYKHKILRIMRDKETWTKNVERNAK